MKYHLVTLGCQMNLSDSERVKSVIEKLGYTWTDKEEDANLIGILACSVRQKAIDKVYSRISKWNKWKKKRELITYISGCILPADELKFLKLFDIVFHMRDIDKLPQIVLEYGLVTSAAAQSIQIQQNEQNQAQWNVNPQYSSGFEAFVPIQNGCDKFCSFCAVPYTRGREVSRSSDDILAEVRGLVESGYKSITLLGQNVNSYGHDRKGTEISFAQLLEKIGEYGDQSDKEFWVYFTSPHPRDMDESVLQTIANYDCLAKQIHIPIQSGDDKVLIKMNRQHNVAKYRKIIENIREILPTATIFTDIIVGFTGETEEQFENTREIMAEFKYNMAYIAQYSVRPGATSSRWDDTVSVEEKKRRYHELSQELQKHSWKNNQSMVGKSYRVLVRNHDRKTGYLSAQTEGKITLRFPSENTNLIGQFVDVKITSADTFSAAGELITQNAEIQS